MTRKRPGSRLALAGVLAFLLLPGIQPMGQPLTEILKGDWKVLTF